MAKFPRVRIALSAILFGVAMFVLIPLGLRIAVSGHLYTSEENVPHASVAVVLGASVVHGEPSPVLAARADTAIALYLAHKVDKILVTGDNAELHYNEVEPVRAYLVHAGVPESDIILDYAGYDTYDSMYRAVHVFHADSMTIVTQDFHLPRALFIARWLGADATGLVARGRGGTFNDYAREIPASIKALLDLTTRRQPLSLTTANPFSATSSLK